ncbi:MAG: hypothetical protein WDZ49_06130 [Litorilinea sp.]
MTTHTPGIGTKSERAHTPANPVPLRVVSISLGSSARNHRTEASLFGRTIILERIGTDGDMARARRLYQELDGQVDCFGVGGADLAITVAGKPYPIRTVKHLTEGLRTPAVDGGIIRRVLEGDVARHLETIPAVTQNPRRAFICVGVARYDLAQGLAEAGYDLLCGDLGFGLGVPVPIRTLARLEQVARVLLPVMVRLPFAWLYPTGADQGRNQPKYADWYNWATVIGDDFHYIYRHMPARLPGKVIVTNTTTRADIDELRRRGVAYVCTTSPRWEGRTFGTNVIEAALTAAAGVGRPLTSAEARDLVAQYQLAPSILEL